MLKQNTRSVQATGILSHNQTYRLQDIADVQLHTPTHLRPGLVINGNLTWIMSNGKENALECGQTHQWLAG